MLEAYVLWAYQTGEIGGGKLRRRLGLETRDEVAQFLADHQATHNYTLDDLEHDRESARLMDPYLEHPTLSPGVHNGLIAALQLSLAPQLRPRYYIALEERVYITEPDQRTFVGRPDLAVVGHTEGGARVAAGLRWPRHCTIMG